jgi:hypothetical protein
MFHGFATPSIIIGMAFEPTEMEEIIFGIFLIL